MSEWISTDQVPPVGKSRESRGVKSEMVMIWWLRAGEDDQLMSKPAAYLGRYHHYSGEWRPLGCIGNFNDEVTHWMPLPEAPEAK